MIDQINVDLAPINLEFVSTDNHQNETLAGTCRTPF